MTLIESQIPRVPLTLKWEIQGGERHRSRCSNSIFRSTKSSSTKKQKHPVPVYGLAYVGIVKLHRLKKAVPLQAWSGPEGSSKLRFPGFMTTAQDGGKVVSLTHRPPLRPGNAPGTHFC